MRYEPATAIGTGPTPGALALERWCVERGYGTAGIYNPRNVRGSSSTLSLHAEGRAFDLTAGNRSDDDVTQLVDQLVRHCDALGVQMVIWQRRSWRIGRSWQPYSGADPHTSHAHIELTRDAAAHLTLEHLERTLTEDDGMTPEQAQQLNDLHFALVGARKFAGDLTAHDLATPILNGNHWASSELPARLDQLAAAMPRALDVELLADAIARRLPAPAPGEVLEVTDVSALAQACAEAVLEALQARLAA
jgi:hypothetical protein